MGECCSNVFRRDCFSWENGGAISIKEINCLDSLRFRNGFVRRLFSFKEKEIFIREKGEIITWLRNISVRYRTAPRLKHRCTEKKKGEKSILRIWWTFQERSNGRATLHEGRDDLQLVNLCVPPRSTIVVSRFNSRDSSISLSTSTKNRIFYIKGRKKKRRKNKNNDNRLHKNQESLFRKLFSSSLHFFFNHLRFFLRLHLDSRGEGGRRLWLVSIREDWQNEPQNNTHGAPHAKENTPE